MRPLGQVDAELVALHLRRLPGGLLVDHYLVSFERVWEQASADTVPVVTEQGGRC